MDRKAGCSRVFGAGLKALSGDVASLQARQTLPALEGIGTSERYNFFQRYLLQPM